jgi:hypothetical protein
MDPAVVRNISGAIEAQTELLDRAQSSLARTAAVSQNPLGYMLSPGASILAPMSIGLIVSANTDLTLARASARELVQKLLAEATAQEFVSNATDASYILGVAWRTPDAQRVPEVSPWDFLAGVTSPMRGALDSVLQVEGYIDFALNTIKRYGPDAWRRIQGWWDTLPGWTSHVKTLGRTLPWVGIGVTLIDLGTELTKPEPNPWMVVRYSGSLIADGVSFVPGPVGWVAAGVGIVWDLGWDHGERVYNQVTHMEEMAAYYREAPWMAAVHMAAPITLDFWGPIAK